MFTKQSMTYVSQCCGAKTLSGGPNSAVVICSVCRQPCRTVIKGDEMKPIEGGIYCQVCAEKLKLSGRIPKAFILRTPQGNYKGTCWGCGATVKFPDAYVLIKKEKKS